MSLALGAGAACNLAAGLDALEFRPGAGGSADGGGGGDAGGAGNQAGHGGASVCDAPLADCDGRAGCETDLTSTAAHCGMCGRDCGADPCVDGACPVTAIATGEESPYDIGFVGGHVYWLNWETGQIRRCASSGCDDQPEVIGESGYWSFYLDLDEQEVFWNNNGYMDPGGSMWRCPLTGCTGGPQPWIDMLPNPTAVALGDDNAYWRSNDGVLQRAPRSGAVATTIANDTGNGEIEADGDAFFWTERENDTVLGCRDLGSGCDLPLFSVTGFVSPGPLAVDPEYVFFGTSNSSGTNVVVRIDRQTEETIVIASDLDNVSGLAVDGTRVYAVEHTTGTIHVLRRDGSGAEPPLDTGVTDAARVAIGDGFAFVALDRTPGSILRYSLPLP